MIVLVLEQKILKQNFEVASDANISGIVSASAYYGSGGGNLENIITNISVSKIEGALVPLTGTASTNNNFVSS